MPDGPTATVIIEHWVDSNQSDMKEWNMAHGPILVCRSQLPVAVGLLNLRTEPRTDLPVRPQS